MDMSGKTTGKMARDEALERELAKAGAIVDRLEKLKDLEMDLPMGEPLLSDWLSITPVSPRCRIHQGGADTFIDMTSSGRLELSFLKNATYQAVVIGLFLNGWPSALGPSVLIEHSDGTLARVELPCVNGQSGARIDGNGKQISKLTIIPLEEGLSIMMYFFALIP